MLSTIRYVWTVFTLILDIYSLSACTINSVFKATDLITGAARKWFDAKVRGATFITDFGRSDLHVDPQSDLKGGLHQPRNLYILQLGICHHLTSGCQ